MTAAIRWPSKSTSGVGEVGAGADDQPGPVEQVGLVAPQLVEQDPLLLGGRVRRQRREVEQEQQHPGPLDVAQEPVPEPSPVAGPLDEPGEVGHDELGVVVEPHHAEVRLEGGERVVGDLRLGRRDRGDEGGLADAREPDQRHVGEQLQLEAQPALLAHLALLGEGRRPPPVRQEPGVAPPAPAALAGQPPLAGADQVGEHDAVLVADGGALGHGHLEVAAPAAVLALALPVGAAAGRPVRVVLEGDQRRHVAVDDEPHAAAVAAVAAVGPALGHVRLAPEADGARAAVTALDVETALVDELRHPARLPTTSLSAGSRLL